MKNYNPIAIVGMSGRFPEARDLNEFWELLTQGIDTVTEIPVTRWHHDRYYHPDNSVPGKTNQKHAALLEGIDAFDPLFFNISPAEAIEMNPSQKLILELAWQLIESSSIPFKKISGSRAGVYIGNIWSDFEHLRKHKNSLATSHSAVGQSSNIIANRISYCLGLRGPSLVLDTGCSSSVVALHLACQSLQDHSTDLGFAGAVNHILDPDQYILLSKFGGLSSRGRCSTFDTNADGFVRGEGGGMLLLKRLEDAEKDGDRIFAVIRGTAVNNNGHNANLPATSVSGQKHMLTEAYQRSGIEPHEIHYVEAHGTGTKLGDPTESRALGEFFSQNRDSSKKLRIGSVKTNIGHLEGAAGIAGMIKVLLAMNNNALPRNLNFNTPNPEIDFEGLKLEVQQELSPWPAKEGETLKAGVNSFGWGGTNAHAVLEQYMHKITAEHSPFEHTRCVLPVSAKSRNALTDYVKEHLKYLTTTINGSIDGFINYCAATGILKPEMEYRKTFVAANKGEMIQKLADFIDSNEVILPVPETPNAQKVVFIFPGQGSQWVKMGASLMGTDPVFTRTMEDCDRAFLPYTGWSLLDRLYVKGESLQDIDFIQPALCAMQIALAELWKSWGLVPSSVVGHSMGEVAAAYVAGSISLDEAARIICTRSALMKTVSGQGGAMAVTELTVAEAEQVIERYPDLSVAVNNSHKSTVLAGPEESIRKVLDELDQRGLFCRQVKVDVASHSRQMEPLMEPLAKALNNIQPQHGELTVYSTVLDAKVGGEILDTSYWVNNLRKGVKFASVMDKLIEDDHHVFVEVSAHPVLTTSIYECLEKAGKQAVVAHTLHRDKTEMDELYDNLTSIHAFGGSIDWKNYYNRQKAPHLALPNYPFQRDVYQIEDRSSSIQTDHQHYKHPLLSKSITLAGMNDTFYWESRISLEMNPWLEDHKVNDTAVLPGAAYVEMLSSALKEVYPTTSVAIENLTFLKAISFEDQETALIQLRVNSEGDPGFEFYFKQDESEQNSWILCANGQFTLDKPGQHKNIEMNVPDLTESIPGDNYYSKLQRLGLQYGDAFRNIENITVHNEQLYSDINVPDTLDSRAGKFNIHPALLDSCFQTLFGGILSKNGTDEQDKTTFLSGFTRFEFYQTPATEKLKVSGILNTAAQSDNSLLQELSADILVRDEHGYPVLFVAGLRGKVITTPSEESSGQSARDQWYYKLDWEELEQKNNITEISRSSDKWLILEDQKGAAGKLPEKLNRLGIDHILATHGESIHKDGKYFSLNFTKKDDFDLLKKEFEGLQGILYCSGRSSRETDMQLLSERTKINGLGLINLVKSLEERKLTHPPQLLIVTKGAQALRENEVDPSQAIPLGLGRTLTNEFPQYKLRRFDLGQDVDTGELEVLISEMLKNDTKESELVIRNGRIYAARLKRHKPDLLGFRNTEFSTEGTYLITGFRGIGFEFMKWMFDKGARTFVLLSRSGSVSPKMVNEISRLEEKGARISVEAADVCDHNGLEEVIGKIKDLKGVIHAAGLVHANALVQIEEEEFTHVLGPKVQGTWNLHRITRDLDLDTFILFSSASSLIGLSGQASYVAANTFLDQFAEYRLQMGLPATSINWGVIKDVGMVADEEHLEKFAKAEGFIPVEIKKAIKAYEMVFHEKGSQIGVFRIDPKAMGDYYTYLAESNYFNSLIPENDADEAETQDIRRVLSILPDTEQQTDALQQVLKHALAPIIKSDAGKIDTNIRFKNLGLDSIMAVQFRNQLEKRMDLKLSVGDFWKFPTITEYAKYLLDRLDIVSGKEQKPGYEEIFITPRLTPRPAYRLICFHDAGGNASLFSDWEDQMSTAVDLKIFEMPGRGQKLNQKPFETIQEFTDALVPHIEAISEVPFAFFGHSMGGLLAFELTRALRKKGARLPSRLIVSSTPQLASYDRSRVDHRMSDEEMVQLYPHLHEDNVTDGELRQMLKQIMRNDLLLLSNYSYREEPPLEVPVVGIYGSEDPGVNHANMSRWQMETSEGSYIIQREGGHHYIHQDREFVLDLIQKELLSPKVEINN